MSEIADARTRLHDHLVLYTAGVLVPERVHLYTPTIVASPCVWISQPGTDVSIAPGSSVTRVRVISFGVYIVPDGYEPAQCALLDELVARVADAVYDLPRAEDGGARPQPIDIGGTTVRGVVHNVDMTVFAQSFCTRQPSQLQGASRG